MKSLVTAVLMLLAAPARAGESGNLGLGVILGNPSGGTAKYFVTETHAIDGGVGFGGGDTVVYADYLWHSWKAVPQPERGQLAGYLGLGGRLRDQREALIGLRTPAGLGYWFAEAPVEIFVELVPVFQFSPNSFVQLDAGIGLRYYLGKR